MFGIPQLKPIDIHFGGVLQQAYRFIDPSGHSDGFKRFLEKPEKERIYRGRYDDPRSFLGALRKYQEQQVENMVSNSGDSVESVLQSFNQATLPSIWYYRNLNYRLASENTVKLRDIQYFDENDRPVVVDGVYVEVSYRIIFVAYNTDSLDALVSAFYLHLLTPSRDMTDAGLQKLPGQDGSTCCNGNIRGFDIPYTAGFNLPASFGDIQSLSVNVIPGVHEDGRIYAAEISEFPVTVPLLRSSSVSLGIEVPDTVDIELWSASNCHG